MTYDQQRLALAEWDGVQTEGWWCTHCQREVAPAFVKFDETHDGCGAPVESMPLPAYTTLDEMHRLEEKLSDRQWYDYQDALFRATGDNAYPGFSLRRYIHAKAEQRREALLKTLSLWKD